MDKKYRVHVTDTNGNINQSVVLSQYPTEVRRIKEMGGFDMEFADADGSGTKQISHSYGRTHE